MDNSNPSPRSSRYQDYLPVILQGNPVLEGFLLAFEKVLTGYNDNTSLIIFDELIKEDTSKLSRIDAFPGLEEIIDKIHLFFDPQKTPDDFLPWLANWVALSLRDDWEPQAKKDFIERAVYFYRLRGTKDGLTQILNLYLKNSGFGQTAQIDDQFENFPYFFQVQLTLSDRDPEKYWKQAKIAQAIIDQEKPAHTYYALKILVPTMQLTQPSQVFYPFQLFISPETQDYTLEIAVILTTSDLDIDTLSKQLVVRIQGNLTHAFSNPPVFSTDGNTFYVQQKLTYQNFLDNQSGLNVTLSNRTDRLFRGRLILKLYFDLNKGRQSRILLNQSLELPPVLKIIVRENLLNIEGNTLISQAIPPEPSGMQITPFLWTDPYYFTLFDPPAQQKLEIAAIVEITGSSPLTESAIAAIIGKITVRFQDGISQLHLLTPETTIEGNKITIKRLLNYQQFRETLDSLGVTLRSINNIEVSGKLRVTVKLNINQTPSVHAILEQNFSLPAVLPQDTLEICYKDESGNFIIKDDQGTVFTVLGTQASPPEVIIRS